MFVESGARRPIAARRFSVFQKMSDCLVRWGVEANTISIAGMLFALLGGFVAAFLTGFSLWSWVGLALCIELRLLCNMLDGMVALGGGTPSRRGELLNEAPDRVADVALLIGVGFAPGADPFLGVIAALAAMSTAYVRGLGVNLGQEADFGGPMAKPHRMHLLAFVALLIGGLGFLDIDVQHILYGIGLPAAALLVIAAGSTHTAGLRLWRMWRGLA